MKTCELTSLFSFILATYPPPPPPALIHKVSDYILCINQNACVYAVYFYLYRHFYNQDNTDLTCCAFHKQTKILIAGFSSGLFALHELPEFNLIHTLR